MTDCIFVSWNLQLGNRFQGLISAIDRSSGTYEKLSVRGQVSLASHVPLVSHVSHLCMRRTSHVPLCRFWRFCMFSCLHPMCRRCRTYRMCRFSHVPLVPLMSLVSLEVLALPMFVTDRYFVKFPHCTHFVIALYSHCICFAIKSCRARFGDLWRANYVPRHSDVPKLRSQLLQHQPPAGDRTSPTNCLADEAVWDYRLGWNALTRMESDQLCPRGSRMPDSWAVRHILISAFYWKASVWTHH